MSILIGSTGFVGSHVAKEFEFSQLINTSNVSSIIGKSTDFLVCAGLPGEKWRANSDPTTDWENMSNLAQIVSTLKATRAVLISTADVYSSPIQVDENSPTSLNGKQMYGVHRAWFEKFFISRFPEGLILRLPGLYAMDVRKNLVHDLMHMKTNQLASMNPESKFQWFDVSRTLELIMDAFKQGVSLLNVTSSPVKAQEVASLFGVTLTSNTEPKNYDIKSIHSEKFGGADGYLFSKETVLSDILKLSVKDTV